MIRELFTMDSGASWGILTYLPLVGLGLSPKTSTTYLIRIPQSQDYRSILRRGHSLAVGKQ